jgi:hypothetical protein
MSGLFLADYFSSAVKLDLAENSLPDSNDLSPVTAVMNNRGKLREKNGIFPLLPARTT